MFTVVAASGCLLIALLVAVRINRGRACRETRSIRLHVPIDAAWERVRDYGALQMSHGRGRPRLAAASSELVRGDGRTPGSVWLQRGQCAGRPWWAEIEIVAVDPPRRIEVSLARDVFGTRSGLAYHRCILDLREAGPRETQVRFRLRARTRGARLTLARTFRRERLRARLLDVGLRSLKQEVDSRETAIQGQA
jgi:polyketide cyclase/dehydrase/lipid transport protein